MWKGLVGTGRGASALALLVVTLAPGIARGADALLGRPVRVWVTGEPTQAPQQGFITLRIATENLEAVEHELRLQVATSPPSTRVEKTVRLAPNEHRQVELLLPPSLRYGNVLAQVKGFKPGSPSPLSIGWGTAGLLVEGRKRGKKLADDYQEHQRLGRDREFPELLDASELPTSLAAYLGYAAVAMLETPADQLTEAQRRALEAYVLTGGTLYVPAVPRFGAFEDLGQTDGALGFGKVFRCDSADGCLRVLGSRGEGGEIPRPASVSEVSPWERHYRSDRLLETARAPAGGFLIIVLLFAAVIGPGSFLVRRRFGPQSLLAFIPLTALVTCGGISSYGVLHEGLFVIHAASQAVTLLDSAHHRATTVSVTGLYASSAPDELRFDGLSTPLLGDSERNLELDETEGLVFHSGLVPSRSYRELLVLSVSPSRARLSARREGERIRVENALGGLVRSALFRFEERLCEVVDLEDGAVGTASCHVSGERDPSGDLTRFSSETLQNQVRAPLAEGEFLAVLDRALFVPDFGLELQRELAKDVQLVRGRLAP